MKLRAISRFSWKDRLYEIGDDVVCPDEVKAHMLIVEGHIAINEEVHHSNDHAAQPSINEAYLNIDAGDVNDAVRLPNKYKKKKK